jgi:hypothetical protein
MMMTLKNDFKVAVDALRVAFKSALDDPNFDDSTLAETWRHFLGMQAIHKKLPDDPVHQDIFFGGYGLAGDSGAGGYDTISFAGADEGYYAGAPVHLYGGMSQDTITFES